MTERMKPGYVRWDTQVRPELRTWLRKRAEERGSKDFGVIEALNEVLEYAKGTLGTEPAILKVLTPTPQARKVKASTKRANKQPRKKK